MDAHIKDNGEQTVEYRPWELVWTVDLESGSGHNRRFPGREPDSTSGDIVAIGTAFMVFDYDTNEVKCLQTLRWDLYRPSAEPDASLFSVDCWTHFWNKEGKDDEGNRIPPLSETLLPKLKDPLIGTLTRVQSERRAVEELLDTAKHWRAHAKKHGYKFRLVSDCASFDFGNLDAMILEHLPDTRGSMHAGGWNGAVRCCTSAEEAILRLVDNHWYRRVKRKGESSDITARLHQLYGVPPSPFPHTHCPDADARNIGWRYLTACAIGNGVYERNNARVEQGPTVSGPPSATRLSECFESFLSDLETMDTHAAADMLLKSLDTAWNAMVVSDGHKRPGQPYRPGLAKRPKAE